MNEIVPLNGMPPLPTVSGNGGTASLSRRAKAAIVVRLLLNEGADLPLEELPDSLQVSLTQQMGTMRTVDRDTLRNVIEEFAVELDSIGLSFPKGIGGALSVLDGKISPQTAARLRKEAGVRQFGDPWGRLRELGTAKLLPVLENESVEVAAVMLSKLSVPVAAELLSRLPGPQARKITYAVSQTNAVSAETIDRIGLSLASQLDAQPVSAFEDGPVERVGAILNSSPTVTRDDVLTGLDETDQGFADAVRKAIFTFGNISTRIAPRDIPRILREVEQERLVIALAGAEDAGFAESRDYILENISARMADSLREEMEAAGKVKTKDGEAAMSDVVATIRELERTGELLLLVDEEDDD